MKKLLLILAAASFGCCMVCCNQQGKTDTNDVETEDSVPATEPIEISKQQMDSLVAENNLFSLKLIKAMNDADRSGKSFIYSPLSITYVLGMVNDAAEGLTEKELEETLGFHEGGIQAVNEYCKTLIEGLPKVDNTVTLNMANAVFVNQDTATLKAQYEQDMQTYYDAKAEALSFKAANTLGHINGWCNEKTKGMIPTILDTVNPYAVAYLLNAIYFNANWASKFDEKNTRKETFTTENGSTRVPLMHQNVLINYFKNDTFAAIEMPYGNGFWKMTVMLPEEGRTTDDVISELAQRGLTKAYSTYEVDLKLPRFETMSDTDDKLIGLLKKMGIRQAFDSQYAQIPNMCEQGNVYISMMRQKAAIKVNEEGSEAAAVTIAGMDLTSTIDPVEIPKASFHANRPFVYLITEASSGVILFVGKFTGA